ncbi:MAG: hypothetical protein GXO62_04350 [Epsilonproteobacteria bacterium]|nr:hypothetical protein [Campylobacterota bacterium]
MVESIKELLAFLRGVFLLLLAIVFSLIAFIYNNELGFFSIIDIDGYNFDVGNF